MYDLAIIGGGPAGYVAAENAGARGLKVVLFEKRELGGVCLYSIIILRLFSPLDIVDFK